MNHSSKYWKLLDEWVPGAKMVDRELSAAGRANAFGQSLKDWTSYFAGSLPSSQPLLPPSDSKKAWLR